MKKYTIKPLVWETVDGERTAKIGSFLGLLNVRFVYDDERVYVVCNHERYWLGPRVDTEAKATELAMLELDYFLGDILEESPDAK